MSQTALDVEKSAAASMNKDNDGELNHSTSQTLGVPTDRDGRDMSGLSSSAASATFIDGRTYTARRHALIVSSKLPSVRPFYGIINDIKARAPYYWSDWTDAWNYRVIPATLLIFFSKCVHLFRRIRGQQLIFPSVLPGIAFSLDLIETTNEYGVAEVLLSSFMAAFVFSVFGAQPLCIAGVTGAALFSLSLLESAHSNQGLLPSSTRRYSTFSSSRTTHRTICTS